MLSKAIILVILATTTNGSPVAKAIGPFQTFPECQALAQTFFAAALVKGIVVTGLCVKTPLAVKDTRS